MKFYLNSSDSVQTEVPSPPPPPCRYIPPLSPPPPLQLQHFSLLVDNRISRSGVLSTSVALLTSNTKPATKRFLVSECSVSLLQHSVFCSPSYRVTHCALPACWCFSVSQCLSVTIGCHIGIHSYKLGVLHKYITSLSLFPQTTPPHTHTHLYSHVTSLSPVPFPHHPVFLLVHYSLFPIVLPSLSTVPLSNIAISRDSSFLTGLPYPLFVFIHPHCSLLLNVLYFSPIKVTSFVTPPLVTRELPAAGVCVG